MVDQALEALVADCESLWAFYRLQDSEWPFAPGPSSAWNSRNPIQDWRGVIVSDGRVTQLTLHRLDLSGTITGDPLHNLTRLKKLHLIGPSEGSQLGGAIPVWLGDATSLRELLLINHNLTGPIPPELANLANLVRLDLSNNQLTGPIPPELANLTNLRHLDVSNNQLTGPIPPELANLTNLRHLDVSNNQLTGPIPPELANPELANLPKRVQIDFSNNPLLEPPETPCTSPTVVDQALEALVADCEGLWAFYTSQGNRGRLEYDPTERGGDPTTAWNRNNPLESWRGVTVEDGRVTRLELTLIVHESWR